jgi:teichuronic acid biosynthesis glycosyltransferase TuaG
LLTEQTLVTCLYDLARRERCGSRPMEFFRRHAALVLDVPSPLVAYVDPELQDWVTEARRERGLADRSRVVVRPLESLPWFGPSRLTAALPTFENSSPTKDSPLHQVIEWSKLELLDEVMTENPFGTEHFAWIDFGLGHVAHPPARFPAPSRRVAVLQMCAVAEREVADKLEFLRLERGRIAAGFFRGDREHLERLVDAFRAELTSVLDAGFRPNEQMVLGYLTAKRPELFDFYYGDYPSILVNCERIHCDVDTVLFNVAHCRAHGMWQRAHAILEAVRASVDEGCLELTEGQRMRLLDEAFVAAWHLGRRDLAAARREEILAVCTGSSYFERDRDRILANLDLVNRIEPLLLAEPPVDARSAALEAAPLVSVVIAVHDGEDTLERAVRSALDQTRRDLEVVVVDDASTDGSLALARALAETDPRVRVIARARCSGSPATPRADGIAAARGRFVALLDQDDYWLSEKLAAQLPLFADEGVAVVYSDAYFLDASSADRPLNEARTTACTTRGRSLPQGDLRRALRLENYVPCLTAVIRRDWLARIGPFDRHRLVGVDDYYCWLRIAWEGGRFAAVHQPLAVRCVRPNSLGALREADARESLGRMWTELAREYPKLRGSRTRSS